MQLEVAPQAEHVARGQEPAVGIEEDPGRHVALDRAVEPPGGYHEGAREVLRQGICVGKH